MQNLLSCDKIYDFYERNVNNAMIHAHLYILSFYYIYIKIDKNNMRRE